MAVATSEANQEAEGEEMVNAAFCDTVVVRAGDEDYPSLHSIILATKSVGLGLAVLVDDQGEPATLRLPHPGPVVQTIMRLATAWDEATARLQAIKLGGELESEVDNATQIAIYAEDGKVWIGFDQPVDGIGLPPIEADRIGTYLIHCANTIREEAGAEDGAVGDEPVEA